LKKPSGRAWLESMLESAPDAVIVTDALGIIRAANPVAEGLLGCKEYELIGKSIEHGLQLFDYESEEHTPLTFTMALQRRRGGIATIRDSQRRKLRVEFVSSPIVDKRSGSTTGMLSVLRKVQEP
jgi:PAS domain S-box-containing protein